MIRISSHRFATRFTVALAVVLATMSSLIATDREDDTVKVVAAIKDSAGAFKQNKTDVWGHPQISWGGACVIDAKRGWVLTNNHVYTTGSDAKIILSDGKEVDTELVFTDPNKDITVLKIKDAAKLKLKEVRMATSSDLMLAEKVIVIGAPLGDANTVTFGRVSTLSREIKFSDGRKLKVVQTDAAINPGNSGGPMFNVNGEYVGTVVAMKTPAYGLGYVIPSDTVDDLLVERLSTSAQSGTMHGITTKVVAKKKEGEDRLEVVVTKVEGAAKDAGIEVDDVLLKIGDRRPRMRWDVERFLGDTKAGGKVEVIVGRAGKEKTTTIKLASSKPEKVETPSVVPPATVIKGEMKDGQ